jgi:tRNA pseudouridine55 synthase
MSESQDNGWLNVFKPSGITSFGVVAQIRKLLGIKKVGHLGTLDPLACGVLPLALGQATRLIALIPPAAKTYLAELHLGVTTDTQDAEGVITATSDFSNVTVARIKTALRQYEGKISQTPPLFSAVQLHGKRLYEFARRGEAVEIPSREVSIYNLRLLSYQPPKLRLMVRCSSGTYIRTLGHDLGATLGCGAYLSFLQRRRSGIFTVRSSSALEVLRQDPQSARGFILPLIYPFKHELKAQVKAQAMAKLRQGIALQAGELSWFTPALPEQPKLYFMLDEPGEVLAVAKVQDGVWQPVRVLR